MLAIAFELMQLSTTKIVIVKIYVSCHVQYTKMSLRYYKQLVNCKNSRYSNNL